MILEYLFVVQCPPLTPVTYIYYFYTALWYNRVTRSTVARLNQNTDWHQKRKKNYDDGSVKVRDFCLPWCQFGPIYVQSGNPDYSRVLSVSLGQECVESAELLPVSTT